jgi:transposase
MLTSLSEANDLITRQALQIEELTKKLHSSELNLSRLQHQVEQLLRRIYGRRSEKMHPDQLMFESLVLEAIGQPAPVPEPLAPLPTESEKPAPVRTQRNHHGRIPIPDHLERVEIILDLPEEQKIDPSGEPLKQIGWETSEKLEYRPGKLIVNVYKRPKYEAADLEGPGVLIAPMPDHPIERCKADVGLIAYLIVSKFADHLPLYRQNGIFEREGVDIPRATQTDWVLQTYEAMRSLEEALKQAVLEGEILHTDDSIIPLQVKGRGKVQKARLWAYVRGGTDPPLTVYDFSHDRSKKRPLDFLGDYQGYVHADAYGGYDELFHRPAVIEVGCWAHTRRHFDEAVSSRKLEATEIMARIGQLYIIEKESAELSPEQRHQRRQERSRPLMDHLFKRIEELKAQTIPSEPLRKAVDYALNQRQALYRYLEDGRLKPDNNIAENAIRPLALGRKNWLFAASERGAKATALFLGLIQSCKACQVNPWEYLDDLLRRLMSHPVHRLRELLPDQWKPLPKNEYGLIIQQ